MNNINVKIEKLRVIEEQDIYFTKQMNAVFGPNNVGKTSLMIALFNGLRKLSRNQTQPNVVFLPTSRLIIREILTKDLITIDKEDFINQSEVTKDNSLHYIQLRKRYLENPIVFEYIQNRLSYLFGNCVLDVASFNHSDGTEDILTIYLEIIWSLTWEIKHLWSSSDEFENEIKKLSSIVLIDEIENYLHLSAQDKLLELLLEDFPGCTFIFTTHSSLLLTRCKNIDIFSIQNGQMILIENDLYYRDIDETLEVFFSVKRVPEKAKVFVDYLNNLLGNVIKYRKSEFRQKMNLFETEYRNIYIEYYNRSEYIRYIKEKNDKAN